MTTATQTCEASAAFACFGSTCAVHVTGPSAAGGAQQGVEMARGEMLSWHGRFSRFDPTSELSLLNAYPGATVVVSAHMASFVQAVIEAARMTAGLVDATLLSELETAGYRTDLADSVPLPRALAYAPPRRPARPRTGSRWREIEVDHADRRVTRPIGVRLDSGGIAKGLCADLLADRLAGHAGFAIDCAGDLRIGGTDGVPRELRVASPFDGSVLHMFELAATGVATSGIGKRSWLDPEGAPAHHLLDPATGRPAFTGIVQATALAPTAREAEIRAKAAVLAGPRSARTWLPHGGLIVLEEGGAEVVARVL
jgi:thiamine biosynthesis lipoprotein